MDDRTERLTWLLGDFKNGRKNFPETILEIERIFARDLGFCIPYDVQKEIDKKANPNG